MTIYERIKYLREKKGMSQQELAEKVGFKTASAVNKIELGLRDINQTKIIAFARALDTTPSYLMGWEETPSSGNEAANGPAPIITDSTVTYPVLGDLAAGYDNLALEDWRGETVEIPVSFLKGHERDEFIVLCVKGDSMYPNYQPGDKVLILRQEDMPASGSVGAVRYNDECATLKIGAAFIRLKPINPQYPPFEIHGEDLDHFSVIGIPKLLIRDIEE